MRKVNFIIAYGTLLGAMFAGVHAATIGDWLDGLLSLAIIATLVALPARFWDRP
jgi:uncharacterized membrane protein YccC